MVELTFVCRSCGSRWRGPAKNVFKKRCIACESSKVSFVCPVCGFLIAKSNYKLHLQGHERILKKKILIFK